MRPMIFLAAVLFLAPSAQARDSAVKIVFERQGASASDWTPPAPVKRTLGIAWDERARADGKKAVFARSVTVTYALAPGLSLSEKERRSLSRDVEAALRAELPSAERPGVVADDEDSVFDYRRDAADRLMRVIEDRSKGLSLAAPLDLPAQSVVVVP
jgi:hypothetical protein